MDHIWIHTFNALLVMINITITLVGFALYLQGYRYTSETEGKTVMRAIILFQASYIVMMICLLIVEVDCINELAPTSWRSVLMMGGYTVGALGCCVFLHATIKRNPIVH